MKNKAVAEHLARIARMLELDGENRFRIRAYSNAAQTISDLAQDVEKLIAQKALRELPGIGEGIAKKIEEYCGTGRMKEHDDLSRRFPPGLLEMMQISGLGPKRTRLVFDELKIDSLQKLRAAAAAGKLKGLAGFGEKIEENILKGIALKDEFSRRTFAWEARTLAAKIAAELEKRCRSLEKIVPAGSLRRWKETVGDLDFLCVSRRPEEVIAQFAGMEGVKQVLAKGETKASILHEAGLQCDLRVVPAESFGAALLYFTGSKEHNVALRELALKKGLTINEYGLYALSDKKKAVAGRSEEEIYEKLGLEFIPPELRENRGEIEAAAKRRLPRLVEEKDVRGDFHNHTDLSDGADSLETMAERAKEKGWEWFVSGDHSHSLKIANGLSPERLRAKKTAIEKMNRASKSFKVLLGSEVDILADGALDYDEASLKEIDFVVASIHTGLSQKEDKIMPRLLNAMRHPRVDIVGHLTGRLIGTRPPYEVNLAGVIAAAAETETALEVNGQPQRMDMNDVQAKAAGEAGVTLALSTDSHAAAQLDYMSAAVGTARRAWLSKEQILNCRGLAELRRWKGAARAA